MGCISINETSLPPSFQIAVESHKCQGSDREGLFSKTKNKQSLHEDTLAPNQSMSQVAGTANGLIHWAVISVTEKHKKFDMIYRGIGYKIRDDWGKSQWRKTRQMQEH